MNVEFTYLADQPELVPQVIRWWHTEWADRMGSDFPSLEAQLSASLSKTSFPIYMLAWVDGEPVGVAALKLQELADLFPDSHYWLGSVYIDEAWRGKKLASKITARIIELARELDLPHLYLQTQNLQGGLYAELGWQPVKQLLAHGEETLLMYLPLNDTAPGPNV